LDNLSNSYLDVLKGISDIAGVNPLFEEIDLKSKRAGEIVSAYADSTRANRELGWKSKSTLKEALNTAWEWEKKIRDRKV